MTTPAFALDAANLARLTGFISVKQPPTVVKQTPAPGTPVVAGMTIEVQAISFSDVPLHVLQPDAPAAIRDVPLAELDRVVGMDAVVKTAVNTGTVAAADRTAVADTFNTALVGRGLAGTVKAADTEAIVGSLARLGRFGG